MLVRFELFGINDYIADSYRIRNFNILVIQNFDTIHFIVKGKMIKLMNNVPMLLSLGN